MNPLPVVAVGGLERPAPEAPEDVAATGLSVATFRIGKLGAPPQFPREARAGETQNASVHVINPLFPSGAGPPAHPANELSVMNPYEARIAALKGTSMWCVKSYTESIAPAAPHLTLKSAARARPAPMPSRFRIGALGTVEYDCRWKMVTPAIDPALRLKSACTHPPSAGEHTSSFGLGVFSFAAPVHQRGPDSAELEGSPLMSARPHDATRQVPGRETPALP